MKVIDGSRTLLTTQCFLPDALSEYLYTQLPTYRRNGVREILNRNDGIALMAGDTVLGAVREARDRYVITLTLVVDPTATAPREPGHPPGPPPPAHLAHPAVSANPRCLPKALPASRRSFPASISRSSIPPHRPGSVSPA
jgi:hypothetical protein